jgi:putative ABC transport system ATP-binding protein
MYQLDSVTKTYDRKGQLILALDNVDLSIERGDLIAVQGPTGGGKSTLLQMLGGLDRPTSGCVIFDGHDLARLSESPLTAVRAKSMGFVFQAFNLIPTLTALENVEAALVPLGVSSNDRRKRAMDVLESVGLADRSSHSPNELSGGQQQRVAIARAVVKQPSVLLADEPTGNLDEQTRDEIVDLLEQLWREHGLTIVVVTHDSAVAARASRRLWIDGGTLSEPQVQALTP